MTLPTTATPVAIAILCIGFMTACGSSSDHATPDSSLTSGSGGTGLMSGSGGSAGTGGTTSAGAGGTGGAGVGGDSGAASIAINVGRPSEVAPASNPLLPSTADVFNPSFTGNTSGASPLVGEWTRSANPGDVVVIAGANFSPAGTDARFWVYGQTTPGNGVLTEALVQKRDGDVVAVTLPMNLPPHAAYILWAENADAPSTPIVLNRTEAWWVGPDAASSDSVASVYGRNLSLRTTEAVAAGALVILEDAAGVATTAEVISRNPYKLDFRVPATLAKGDYTLWVHNGHGGAFGWAKPLAFTVSDALEYDRARVNVRDHGAVGNGTTDDTNAVNAALAATSDWTTLYFPSGTYSVRNTLNPRARVRWLGDGKDQTKIQLAPGSGAGFLLESGGGADQVTFEDMTLDGNAPASGIQYKVIQLRSITDLHFVRVRIDGSGTAPFDIQSDQRVLLRDCEVIGSESFLGSARQVFIDRTTFLGTDNLDILIHGFGVQDLAITNSIGRNFDNSSQTNGKWVKGRFFADQQHWGISKNQYFGAHETIDLVPPTEGVDRNSGEQIMWEAEGSEPLGTVTGATQDSVTVDDAPDVSDIWNLSIVGGRGLGQNRQIQSLDPSAGTYRILGTWNIQPDATSVIVASKVPNRVVVYDNRLDGAPEPDRTNTASSGVQLYPGGTDVIVDGNTFNQLNAGVSLWAGVELARIAPIHFIQITNNTFVDNGNAVLVIVYGFDGASGPLSGERSFLGAAIRDNAFEQVDDAINFSADTPDVAMNVIQSNSLGTFLNFVSGANPTRNNVFVSNTNNVGSVVQP